MTGDDKGVLLRRLPSVDALIHGVEEMDCRSGGDSGSCPPPRSLVRKAARETVEALRARILACEAMAPGELDRDRVLIAVDRRIREALRPAFRPVINAAGVVVHTNLGRSLLSGDARKAVAMAAGRYGNLEYDLDAGRRGLRYTAVEPLLCELTGAPAAMAVNNNAAAVLLSLSAVAAGREVVISRGELVEIGGSFRIPDVMNLSGAVLREVGTTNRTRPSDYETAAGPDTGLLLKVHTSNFAVVGFAGTVSLSELVEIGAKTGIPVMEDLGSGMLVDLSAYGLTPEPTVQDSVAAGADLVTFSGDKLLGGPQAGIILGSEEMLVRIRAHPLTRAVRVDKMTLAALEATLALYRDPRRAARLIPTLRMITAPVPDIADRARRLANLLAELDPGRLKIAPLESVSRVGGGALPLETLPTVCLSISVRGLSAAALEKRMRRAETPVIGRIENDHFLLDMRTVGEEELPLIRDAVSGIITH